MGTEAFVELLWRIHSKPGIISVSSGKVSYVSAMQAEETPTSQTVSTFFNTTFPDALNLGNSTFGDALW